MFRMRNLRLLWLFLSLAPACRQRQERPLPRIVVILPTADNPYWQVMQMSLQAEKRRLADSVTIEILAGNADDGAQRQIEFLNSARATSRVDGLILGPASGSEVVPAVAEYAKAGAAIVIVDSKLDDNALRARNAAIGAFVGSDNRQGGSKAAAVIANHLGGIAARILLVEGNPVHASALDRQNGFKTAAPPQWAILEVRGDWNRDIANRVTRGALVSGVPAAIFAASDEMALGVIEALHNAGVEKRDWPIIVGFDATEEGIAAIDRGDMCATVRQRPDLMAQYGIEAVRGLMRGEAGIQTERLLNVEIFPSANVKCK